MARTVDQRVVEMRLENGQFEQETKSTISMLDRLKQALKFDNASTGLENVSRAAKNVKMESLSAAVDDVNTKFSALQEIGVGALRSVGASVASTVTNLVKQFAISPITSGLSEYQEKMDSIKVTMANTGRPLQDVKDALEELNLYADKTIYSFADMTKSIGLFTAQGVSLEDATAAIQGISNLAAVTGANSEQASRAMFNFAQALSAGEMKLVDWKTMMNTGMGNDRFRQEVIQVARDLGYMSREFSYGQNQTISGFDALVEAEENFSETLKYGWMDNEVMLEVLKRYSSEEFEIGRMASKAATEVNTFAKLMDATGESLQSSWGQVWELIIGDYEESTKLWTDVSNSLGETINGMFSGMIASLKEWRALGGRDDVLEGLSNSIKLVTSVIEPFKNAFKQIFPPATGQQLADMSKKFADFTSGLKLNSTTAYYLQEAFGGFLSIFKTLGTAVGAVVEILSPLGTALNAVGGALAIVAGKIGGAIKDFSKFVETSEGFKTAVSGLKSVVQAVSDAIVDLVSGSKPLTTILSDLASGIGEGLGQALSGVGEYLREFGIEFLGLDDIFEKAKAMFDDFSLSSVVEFAKSAKDSVVEFIKNLTEGFSSGFNLELPEGLTKFLDKIKTMFSNVDFGDIFEQAKESLAGFKDGLLTAGEALAPFASGLADLTAYLGGGFKDVIDWLRRELQTLSFDDVKDAIEVGFLANLSLSLKKFFDALAGVMDIGDSVNDVLGAVKDTLVTYQKQLKYDNLVKIATAIGILAASVVGLSLIPAEKLTTSVLALGAIGAELMAFMTVMSKIADQTENVDAINKLNTQLVVLSVALLGISSSVKKLAGLDWEELARGLTGLTVILGELIAFSKLFDNSAMDKESIGSLVTLATTMSLLLIPLKVLAGMEWDSLVQGLMGLGVVFTELATFSKLTDSVDLTKISGGITALSVSMGLLSGVIAILGTMELETLAKGLGAMAVTLGELVLALNLLPEDSKGAESIKKIATAMALLTAEIAVLGSLEMETLAQGLIAIGVALAEMLAAGAIATTVAPGLTALSTSLTALGATIALISAGFLAFSLALSPLMDGLEKFGKMSDTTIKGILKNLETFAAGLLTSVASLKGKILEALLAVIQAIVEALEKAAPDIAHGALVIILELLKLLEEYGPQIVETVVNIIVDLINGIANKMDEIVDAAFNLIFSFFDAIVDAIDKYIGIDLDAMADAAWDIVSSFFDSVKKFVDDRVEDVRTAFSSVVNIVRDTFDSNSPSKVMQDIGKDVVNGFANGVEKNAKTATDSAGKMAQGVIDKTRDVLKSHSDSQAMIDVGKDCANGLANGLKTAFFSRDNQSKVESVATKAIDVIKNAFSSNSEELTESAKTDVGNAIGDGVSKGIEEKEEKVATTSKKVGKTATDSIKEGAEPEETGKDIAEELMESLAETIDDLAEDLQQQALDRAEDIRNIFEQEFSKISLDTSINNLEYQLWESSIVGQNASEYEKIVRQIESLKGEMEYQAQDMLYSKAAWEANVLEFGEASNEARTAYQNMLKSQIAFNQTANEITKLQTDFNQKQTEAQQKYYAYIEEQTKAAAEGKQTLEDYLNLYENARKASGYDPDMHWEELKNDVQQIVENSLKMVDATYKLETEKRMTEINKEYDALAEAAIQATVDGLNEGDEDISDATEEIIQNAIKTIEGLHPDWQNAGKKAAEGAASGISSGEGSVRQAGSQIAQAGTQQLQHEIPSWLGIGRDMALGMAQGIQQASEEVFQAAAWLGIRADEVARNSLQIRSPSRVFRDIGEQTVAGLADGLSDTARVDRAAEAMAEVVSQAYNRVEEYADQEFRYEPVIRPVIDMSNIKKANFDLTNMAPVRIDGSVAQMVARNEKTPLAPTEEPVMNVTNNYNMTQNNTSPKALSEYDIYRQTRNLFSRVKEASMS